MVADDLQHLCCTEAVDQDVLCHLRHIAAIGRFVEYDIDVLQGGLHGGVVLHVSLDELCRRVNPLGLAGLVGLRLEVIKDANGPAFAEEEVDDV
jgi:hypothetical protein